MGALLYNNGMKVRIEIDTQTFVRFWLVVIAFALAALLIYSARTGLIIVGTALFLALALNGPVTALARKLPGKSRLGSTAISYVLIMALVSVFTFLAIPPVVQQTARFAQTVPTLVNDTTARYGGLNDIIQRYNLQPQVDSALDSIKNNASNIARNAGGTLASSVSSIFSFLAAFFLVLVLSFLMLLEGPAWMKRIWSLYQNPALMRRHRNVAQKMHHVVSGYVVGQLTVSGIGAVAAGITVAILGLVFGFPANLAIPSAALTFVLSLVPMFGATIGGIVVALLIAFNAPYAALIYIVFFILYQQVENNFISPSIQSKRLDLSALTVLVAVTIGLYLFGIAGGIISIPIAGSIKVLIEDYLEHAKKVREDNHKPLHRLAKKLKEELPSSES